MPRHQGWGEERRAARLYRLSGVRLPDRAAGRPPELHQAYGIAAARWADLSRQPASPGVPRRARTWR